MSVCASIIIPTRDRAGYLEVALASIAPQAREHAAEVLVIDDAGSSPERRALSERFGACYEPHDAPLGLNVARNSGVQRSRGELVVFLDDDIRVAQGWLGALLQAAADHPEVQVFTGPIHARLEGHPPRSCGREGPPITALELGDVDTQTRYAWGANMAIRRGALERVGPFDVSLEGAGDEQEWQDRLFDGEGGCVLYVAGAAVDHRRTAADSRLAHLMSGARARGAGARRFDSWRGQAPTVRGELWTLCGCLGHVIRYRCPAGLAMVAHSYGRFRQALDQRRGTAPAQTVEEDFLSGSSGTVAGLDGVRRAVVDELTETVQLIGGRRLRLALAARRAPSLRQVLVLGIERPQNAAAAGVIRAELLRSRHAVSLHFCRPDGLGKFENLNRLMATHGRALDTYDWLLVVDDDVELPRGFLDRLLFLAERFSLDLAQPAHRARSHAAWLVTRRRARSVMRETRFVEIGPVSVFARRTFSELLPFPPLGMGWGLDLHWGALAQTHGWRCGVIDALAIGHIAAPAASAYPREAAIAEARSFLAEHPYISARAAQQTLVTHRRW
ncbi:MAG TPA: glycosyltransferase [Solirubrobacteraceae bacterium]